ncbi:MAG: ThuA domain-containing protein [Verrucomicrobia bacterium]|nr:ThuA domain-containing protein [Verrucomicrobiota bacterium]
MNTLPSLLALALALPSALTAAPAKVLFISGSPSHGVLQHEHRAGFMLFQKCLATTAGIVTELHTNGWVQDEKAFENAAAIVLYSSGGGGLPFLRDNRLEKIGALMQKGVGFGCIHYAVEPTREKGQKEWLDWIGGAFEAHWSVNPHWDADFKELPRHPVTRGVKPFKTNDEWYFHMRFREGMKDVTPILTALAPATTMNRTDGTHSGNPAVREAVKNGAPQHVMWAATRPDGGRGFGFTGGHNHLGWRNDDQRKLVLNAILWLAKVEVPANGVESKVTEEDMMANLDPKGGARPKAAAKKEEPKKDDAKK